MVLADIRPVGDLSDEFNDVPDDEKYKLLIFFLPNRFK
jgi:hypothetical protein